MSHETDLARLDDERAAVQRRADAALAMLRDVTVALATGEPHGADLADRKARAEADHDEALRCLTVLDRMRAPIVQAIAQEQERQRAERRRAAVPEAKRLERAALDACEAFAAAHAASLRYRRDHGLPHTGETARYTDRDGGLYAVLRRHGLTERLTLR